MILSIAGKMSCPIIDRNRHIAFTMTEVFHAHDRTFQIASPIMQKKVSVDTSKPNVKYVRNKKRTFPG